MPTRLRRHPHAQGLRIVLESPPEGVQPLDMDGLVRVLLPILQRHMAARAGEGSGAPGANPHREVEAG